MPRLAKQIELKSIIFGMIIKSNTANLPAKWAVYFPFCADFLITNKVITKSRTLTINNPQRE